MARKQTTKSSKKVAARAAKKSSQKKRLSAPVIQDLRTLADQIGKIIPASSPNKKSGVVTLSIEVKDELLDLWVKSVIGRLSFEAMSKTLQTLLLEPGHET